MEGERERKGKGERETEAGGGESIGQENIGGREIEKKV